MTKKEVINTNEAFKLAKDLVKAGASWHRAAKEVFEAYEVVGSAEKPLKNFQTLNAYCRNRVTKKNKQARKAYKKRKAKAQPKVVKLPSGPNLLRFILNSELAEHTKLEMLTTLIKYNSDLLEAAQK